MAEGDGLGRLQVCHSRHDRRGMPVRLANQGFLETGEGVIEMIEVIAQPQAQVRRDLVVARTRRVQTPGRLTDEVGETGLDVHVDIFQRRIPGHCSFLDLAGNAIETLLDGIVVGGREDARGRQHGGMGPGSGNVVRRQLAVKVHRGVDPLHDGGRLLAEAPAPDRVGVVRC